MKNKKIKIYIGMDVGVKFIGIAIGNSITCSVRPLYSIKYTIEGDNFSEASIIELRKIFNEWRPNAIVIGKPLNMDGTEFWMTEVTDKFSNIIKKLFHIEIYRQDERLTTIEAKNIIFKKFGYKGLKKDNIDSYSAAIILEDFIGGLS